VGLFFSVPTLYSVVPCTLLASDVAYAVSLIGNPWGIPILLSPVIFYGEIFTLNLAKIPNLFMDASLRTSRYPTLDPVAVAVAQYGSLPELGASPSGCSWLLSAKAAC
jgi:hypothetical protein